jgi:hypothetical protein
MLFLRLFSSPVVRNSHLRLLNRRQHANRSPTAPTLPRPRRPRSCARRAAPRPGRPRAAPHVAQPRPRSYTVAHPTGATPCPASRTEDSATVRFAFVNGASKQPLLPLPIDDCLEDDRRPILSPQRLSLSPPSLYKPPKGRS